MHTEGVLHATIKEHEILKGGTLDIMLVRHEEMIVMGMADIELILGKWFGRSLVDCSQGLGEPSGRRSSENPRACIDDNHS